MINLRTNTQKSLIGMCKRSNLLCKYELKRTHCQNERKKNIAQKWANQNMSHLDDEIIKKIKCICVETTYLNIMKEKII